MDYYLPRVCLAIIIVIGVVATYVKWRSEPEIDEHGEDYE